MLPNLKLLRKEYKVSQKALAEAIGISQQSINVFENHDTFPTVPVLMSIADYFNTSMDYIVGRTDIRRPVMSSDLYGLNKTESETIERYRTLSASKKNSVDIVVRALSEE